MAGTLGDGMADIEGLKFRSIDPDRDAGLAFEHYQLACAATYGRFRRARAERYLPWLKARVEEYPEGHVLAYLGDECVGQMELQVPYGLTTGYVNLFYVAKAFRRRGVGRAMHERAEMYFRSWEANRVELDVALSNTPAVRFYRAMGYSLTDLPAAGAGLVRMAKGLRRVSQAV